MTETICIINDGKPCKQTGIYDGGRFCGQHWASMSQQQVKEGRAPMKLSDHMRHTGTTPPLYNISNDTWIFRNPFDQSRDLTITADTIRGVHNDEFNVIMYKWDDVVRQHKRENA